MKKTTVLKRLVSLMAALALIFTMMFIPGNTAKVYAAQTASYNRQAAADYALKYWQNYNPAYSNYNPAGGDCANFVSQCLIAGGLQMDSNWYWRGYSDRSGTWTLAPLLKNYLISIGGQFIENPSKSQIEVGDVLFCNYSFCNSVQKNDYGHVYICSEVINGVPWVCSHNSDRHYSTYNMGYSRFAVVKMNKLVVAGSSSNTSASQSNSKLPALSESNYCEYTAYNDTAVYRDASFSTRGTCSPAQSYNAYISKDDVCRIVEMADNYIKLQYPTSSGYRTGYIKSYHLFGTSSGAPIPDAEVLTSKGKTTTYTRWDGPAYGYIEVGDKVYGFGAYGYGFITTIYEARSGSRAYKLGYVPMSYYDSTVKGSGSSSNTSASQSNAGVDPIGDLNDAGSNEPGKLTVRGWAFDSDNGNICIDVHVYVGGPAGSGYGVNIGAANGYRPDVNNVYGSGNYHGFSSVIDVPESYCGKTQDVYVYAINIGGGSNQLIGKKSVYIKANNPKLPSLSESAYCEFISFKGIAVYTDTTFSTQGSASPAQAYSIYIAPGDVCRIIGMADNYIKVQYPTSSGYRTGYIKSYHLFGTSSGASIPDSEVITSKGKATTYTSWDGQDYGYIAAGDQVYGFGAYGYGFITTIYEARSGSRAYKLGYVPMSHYNNTVKGSGVSKLPALSESNYCEFTSFKTIGVYTNASFSTQGTSSPAQAYNAYIESGDVCRIIEMANNYLKVQYPTSSGYRTGYIKSYHLFGTSSGAPIPDSEVITSKGKTTTYTSWDGQDYGYIAAGDQVYGFGAYGYGFITTIYEARSGSRAYKLGYVPMSYYNGTVKG